MELRNFINGKFIDSISKKNIDVINPANQELVGKINQGLEDEIHLAYQAARKAFQKRILIDMDPKEKSKIMRAVASKLREYKHEGGKLLSKENGKQLLSVRENFLEPLILLIIMLV